MHATHMKVKLVECDPPIYQSDEIQQNCVNVRPIDIPEIRNHIKRHILVEHPPPRGGGGTQIWFRRGYCAAEAAKHVPIFNGHFGGKGYPLLGVFIQENYVFVYISDEMGENI